MKSFSAVASLKSMVMGLLFVTVCAASCKRDGGKAALNPAATAEVKAQFDILRDSADLKWRVLTDNDDRKIGTIRLLLRELQAVPGVDAAQVQTLARSNNHLQVARYDRETMRESALIDRYDAAQDSLLHALYPIAAPDNNAPTENVRNFVEGVQQLDANVVPQRIDYDRYAKQYNNYLKLHREQLETLGGNYAGLRPLPLFELAQ